MFNSVEAIISKIIYRLSRIEIHTSMMNERKKKTKEATTGSKTETLILGL